MSPGERISSTWEEMDERAFEEEGWEGRGTGCGREEGGKDGEGREEKEEERDKAVRKEERSWDKSVSTLPLWIIEEVGGARRWGLNFEERLERNLLLVDDDFFRPSEKTNGDEWGGYCNMGDRGWVRLADNRRRLAQEESKARWCICSDGLDLLSVWFEWHAACNQLVSKDGAKREKGRGDGGGGEERKGISPGGGEGRRIRKGGRGRGEAERGMDDRAARARVNRVGV
jgi:hypothetical protein